MSQAGNELCLWLGDQALADLSGMQRGDSMAVCECVLNVEKHSWITGDSIWHAGQSRHATSVGDPWNDP